MYIQPSKILKTLAYVFGCFFWINGFDFIIPIFTASCIITGSRERNILLHADI